MSAFAFERKNFSLAIGHKNQKYFGEAEETKFA